MKKKKSDLKKYTVIFLVVLVVFIMFFLIKAKQQSKENLISKEDFLSTSGTQIVNKKGDNILLEGVNLGGWLLQEYWMCPIIGDSQVEQWTNLETIEVLERRFGEEKAEKLIGIYEDNWITEWDIKNIADRGCNVIRIPFWYRNFMKDSEGTWLTKDLEDNPGIQRLDWLIKKAGEYGIYVILDMHGCPGGQNEDHSTGNARKCQLFTDEKYQNIMEELWVTLAARYKDNPVIAAYDIMNEPQVFEGEVKEDPRNILYDRMIKAIRKVDSEHIITIEGYWGINVLPNPNEMGWENIIYQVHSYNVQDINSYCDNIKKYGEHYNIPVYIGEFSDMNFINICRDNNISFTSWTYKGIPKMEDTWFMYSSNNVERVDIYNDSYKEIKRKWGDNLSTKKFDENKEIIKYWN